MSAFFLAKVLTDLIPARIVPLLVYCAIAYFMVGKCLCLAKDTTSVHVLVLFSLEGLEATVEKYFIFLLTVNLASITSTSIAFAVSAGTGVTAIANLFIAMTFTLSMVSALTCFCSLQQSVFPS